jgi:lon-related putative ATP-dependent protease
MPDPVELLPSQLRSSCDPSIFDFNSTAEIEPLVEVIGQQRAVQAIRFGLNMDHPRYHIFISGIDGSGRTTIVRDLTRNHARSMDRPDDWCLVNNFKDEFRPIAIELPSGKAAVFSRQVERLVRSLRKKIPEATREESFEKKKEALYLGFEEEEKRLFRPIEEKAATMNLFIQKTATTVQPVPLKDGQPMTREAFEVLPEDQRLAVEKAMGTILVELEEAAEELQLARMELGQAIDELLSHLTRSLVSKRLAPLRKEYAEFTAVQLHLKNLEDDIVDNVALFLPANNHSETEPETAVAPAAPELRYHVNILVDNAETVGAPVIFEPNPTFRNLFGCIEKRAVNGIVTTDFSMVQAGSLLQANGGFLIMELDALLHNSEVWEALKRALLNRKLFIEEAAAYEGQVTASLRPCSVDLNVKILIIGNYRAFEFLQNSDPKFNEIFKVRADFDYEVTDSVETSHQYARFIGRVCRKENLKHFSPGGVAAIIEACKTISGHQNKLSLRFGPIISIIKEAEYWAKEARADLVTADHVKRALDEHRFRYNLYEEKVHESYLDETLLIDVDGAEIGQVNALAVYQMGEIAFGRPARITAETYMGRNGLVNIDREAGLSGNTHDKGVLILSGYLGRMFAANYPLCLSASITFEQNYDGVDGDSASSTELYAILSSLSRVPVYQGIAVTGSVNQKGMIQAIGGVNEKVEGFFEVCKSKGLTGKQGVIIPQANVQNLMLSHEVVDAVSQGLYHIYPVKTIEQGIEILTGVVAGGRSADGEFPDGTIYGKVQRRLNSYFNQMLKWQQTISLMQG